MARHAGVWPHRFISYFQLLKYFPGALEPIATVAIPLFLFGSMMLLPFIDTSEERRLTGIAFKWVVY